MQVKKSAKDQELEPKSPMQASELNEGASSKGIETLATREKIKMED